MANATSVFLVSTYQNIMALSRRKKGPLLTSLNIMLSSVAVLLQIQSILLLQLYMQHKDKQQAAFLRMHSYDQSPLVIRREDRKMPFRPGTEKNQVFTWIFDPGMKFRPSAEDRDEIVPG